jgi:hypothetical protein
MPQALLFPNWAIYNDSDNCAPTKVLKPAAEGRDPREKLVLKPLVFFMKFMKFMRLYFSFHINSRKK